MLGAPEAVRASDSFLIPHTQASVPSPYSRTGGKFSGGGKIESLWTPGLMESRNKNPKIRMLSKRLLNIETLALSLIFSLQGLEAFLELLDRPGEETGRY